MAVLLAAAALAAPADEMKDLGEGPIHFRCDTGQGFSKPNRFICRDNVVVRRGKLMVCCQLFEGYTDEAGDLQRFICQDDVRAQRGDETMWAKKATYITQTSDLILTGRPVLRRGKSLLRGERIVVDTKQDRAHVENPRGQMLPATESATTAPKLPLEGDPPNRCPIPKGP